MYKISFNCADYKLPTMLNMLGPSVSVRVEHCADTGEVLENKNKIAKAQAASVVSKKRRAAQRKQTLAGSPFPRPKKEQARQLIRELGFAPFRAGEVCARAAAIGLSKPSVYNAIYSEIAAGNLRKLETGLYQKTGAAGLEAVNG